MTGPKPDALRSFDFFRGVSDEAFAALSRSCRRTSFGAKELIIAHEDRSSDVLFLKRQLPSAPRSDNKERSNFILSTFSSDTQGRKTMDDEMKELWSFLQKHLV